jgi:hypothetical protein
LFGSIKKIWNESGIAASVDGVLREAARGNAVEVQKWYFKLKKDAFSQAKQEGVSPKEIEKRALSAIAPEKLAAYLDIVRKLTRPGGVLADIDSWLESYDPE